MSRALLSFVLLDNPATLDMDAFIAALRVRHPELASEVRTSGTGKMPKDTLVFHIGDQTVAVALMPSSLPQDSGLWSRATTMWPEAPKVAAQHRGHLMVSVLGQNLQMLPRSRLLTAIVGTVIASMPECCAVVWAGKVVRPADLWLNLSTQSFAPFPDYPFILWVDVLPFRTKPGIGAVTMGLSAFVEREIEFVTSKLTLEELIDKVCGLAVYLIEHGQVIKDGDTFGGDMNERMTVRHKNSDRFGGMPVLLGGDS